MHNKCMNMRIPQSTSSTDWFAEPPIISSCSLFEEVEKLLQGRNFDAVTAAPEVLTLLHERLSSASDYIENKLQDLEQMTKASLHSLQKKKTFAERQALPPNNAVDEDRVEIEQRCKQLLEIHANTMKVQDHFESIRKFTDSQLPATSLLTKAAINGCFQKLLNHSSVSTVLVALSDAFEILRAREIVETKSNDQSLKKWEAVSIFERSTSKYWIQDFMLARVVCAVLQEAPILVCQPKPTPLKDPHTQTPRSEGDKLWGDLATNITSVYFDSEDFCLYKERLKRDQGAQLFRIRWYGDVQPTGASSVFLELKTHHEKWVNATSVKERICLQEKDVHEFLDPAGGFWDSKMEAPRLLVLRGTKSDTIKGIELQTKIDLICRMRNLVLSKNLQPCVRTQYRRLAFQSSKCNNLRVTIDRDVCVVDEKYPVHSDSWCLSEEEANESSRRKNISFPILEVKLAGGIEQLPARIQDMVNDFNVIEDGYKFSKYLTGAASFANGKISKFPYWAEHPRFVPLFEELYVENINSTEATSSSGSSIEGPPTGDQGFFRELNSRRKRSDKKRSTCGTSRKMAASSFSMKLGASFGSNPKNSISSKKTVRVEPRSYFANERTYIQWISAALLLITIAAIITESSDRHSEAVPVAISLVAFSALIVVYAIFVYYRRLVLLKSAASYGYVDRIGPVFLGIGVLSGVIVLILHLCERGFYESSSAIQSYLTIGEQCHRHSLNDVNQLFFEPSDALFDKKRGLLLVPSMNEILGVPLNDSGANTTKLVNANGRKDFEALASAGDRIFAISEEKKKSELYEYRWLNDFLSIVDVWELDLSMSEGIAVIDDQLWIADNSLNKETSELNGGIFVFDIPSPGMPFNNEPRKVVNRKILGAGMKSRDTKVGGLTFFEEKLYVLHDNAGLIRVWDHLKGQLLYEIALPTADDGSGQGERKQWEGISFERRSIMLPNDEENVGLLRAKREASSSRVILHIALDTPAQVWSINLIEDANSQFSLPLCAGFDVSPS